MRSGRRRQVEHGRHQAGLEGRPQQLDRSLDGELADREPVVGDRPGVLGVLRRENGHGESAADPADQDTEEGAGGGRCRDHANDHL